MDKKAIVYNPRFDGIAEVSIRNTAHAIKIILDRLDIKPACFKPTVQVVN